MRRSEFLTAAAICGFLGACQQASGPPAAATAQAVTDEEAGNVFDATVAAWQSQDAARIKALYAPDFAGFDFTGPLITDRATWDKAQEAYAAEKLDKVVIGSKKVQLLGPDAFVVSSYGKDSSSAGPQNNIRFRCTDIFKRDAEGNWSIVSENCSSAGAG